jgi:hypothetical protein
MKQVFLTQTIPGKDVRLSKPYNFGPFNVEDGDYQVIRLSEGCPNRCPYCAEPLESKWFGIPEITKNNVRILDMNLLSKKEAYGAINYLGRLKVNKKVIYYELVCGIDYRIMTQELADLLHKNRFINIRIAWDWGFKEQRKIRAVLLMLRKAGYNYKDVGAFMITNWRISYEECERKRELCAIWNIQVLDCIFDNQSGKTNPIPIFWKSEELRAFRKKVRKQNQLVNFGIDPEEPSINGGV